jgi:tetratricopeptide (TPR) repeat protein
MEFYYKKNDHILTLLKQSEQYEVRDKYEEEIDLLFQLKNIAEYKDNDLRHYIAALLDLKEKTYFQIALDLEKEKKWEKVGSIYKSILKINKDNFNANYRLGILSITLQDLDSAFSYLQKAMSLEKNNPAVMHQMGVLLFSSGKYREALQYLNRALSGNKKQAPTYFYIGLCYEELNQLQSAKEYYTQAHVIDPNDEDIASSIERLNDKLEKERNKWKLPPQKTQLEEEQGENIPLPINKRALDNRLKDKIEPNE